MTSTRAAGVPLLLACLVLCLPRVARAGPDGGAPGGRRDGGARPARAATDAGSAAADPVMTEARAHFARGLDRFSAHDFAGAREAFEAAHRLAPAPRLVYYLGLCSMEEGDPAGALARFEEYERDAGATLAADRRTELQELLSRARGQLAYLTVRTNVADADLVLDQQPRGRVTADPIGVNPGTRTLSASKPGYASASRVVTLESAERVEVLLELRELPKAAPAEVHPPRAPRSRALWLIPFAGAALAIGLTIAVVVRRSRRPVRAPPRIARRRSPRPVVLNPYDQGAELEVIDPEPEHVLHFVHDPPGPGPGQHLTFASGAATDRGRVKPTNQDRHLVDDAHGLYVVADGIGGFAGGEVASAIAVDRIKRAFANGPVPVGNLTHVPPAGAELASAFFTANTAIRRRAASDWNVADMGTTCVAIRFCPTEHRGHVVHVGDSRAYRLRGGRLERLTTDHTMGIELGITGARANHLSRALGSAVCPKLDLITVQPQPGDVYLLCCDGLTKMVADEEIGQVLQRPMSPPELATELVARANHHGGTDNITAVVVRVGGR